MSVINGNQTNNLIIQRKLIFVKTMYISYHVKGDSVIKEDKENINRI
jgi:hypothetical protein